MQKNQKILGGWISTSNKKSTKVTKFHFDSIKIAIF